MFIISFASIILLFISAKADTSSDSWTFYAVTPDCHYISGNSTFAIQDGLNNYNPVINQKACENISSAVYQTSKVNHILFIRFESPKEISIAIQQVNGSTNFDITESFKKVNYEYMLGDYCNFDKTLLSIGIDSNLAYITVKCGEELWAFMRSVLTASGDFYTPSGPLIYFKKGNPSFDRLLFLTTGEDSNFGDSVVLRYTTKEDSTLGTNISYFATYLHELNNTQSNLIGTQNVASSKNIFFASSLFKFLVAEGPSNNEAQIKFFTYNPSNIVDMSKLLDLYSEVNNSEINLNKDPTFIRTFGCFLNVSSNQQSETITWKIRDTERIANNKNEDCALQKEKENENAECEEKVEDKKKTYVFIALYFVAGAELLLLIATISALIAIIIITKKKSKNGSNNVDEANVTLLGHISTKDD